MTLTRGGAWLILEFQRALPRQTLAMSLVIAQLPYVPCLGTFIRITFAARSGFRFEAEEHGDGDHQGPPAARPRRLDGLPRRDLVAHGSACSAPDARVQPFT